ncbi:unnamed protein product [Rotaria sp. Silwood2]|nr:unnamed protein product [Rotaria sp. Silwood2]
MKKSIDEVEIKKQQNLIDNQTIEFNHEYCDVMYDNEFEGLHLLHFSSYDIESPVNIKDFQLSNNIIRIQNEQITNNDLTVDIKPSESIVTSVPLTISNNEKRTIDEPDYIILSSDDEEEKITRIVPSSSTTTILPIYLLNRL